jgi:hypothetical protein
MWQSVGWGWGVLKAPGPESTPGELELEDDFIVDVVVV